MFASLNHLTNNNNDDELANELFLPDKPRKRRLVKLSCQRYIVALLLLLAYTVFYAQRSSLSVALVAMVNRSAVHQDESLEALVNFSKKCHSFQDNSTIPIQHISGEFLWNTMITEQILAAFFYGFVVTQLPGGWLTYYFGGKTILLIAMFVSSIMNLLTPLASHLGAPFLITIKVIEGLSQGPMFAAVQSIWSKWAPPSERSRLVSWSMSGIYLGIVIGNVGAGYMSTSFGGLGWPCVFYIFGSCGCVWCILWAMLYFDSPKSHPMITKKEKEFIEFSLEAEGSQVVTHFPWRGVLTSLPLWSIILSSSAFSWQLFTLSTNLPQFLRSSLKFRMDQNGFLSALPFLSCWIVIMTSGCFADLLITKNILKKQITRKLFNSIGLLIPAVFIVLASFVECNRNLVIVYFCLSMSFSAFVFSGFMPNTLDIASKLAGQVSGMVNFAGAISGLLCPNIAGILTKDNNSQEQWQLVFIITASINVLAALFYIIFGSTNIQPWATTENVRSKELTA